MTVPVGKPNYNGGSTGKEAAEKITFYKLGHKEDKQRTLIVRVGPPKGKLAEKGIWRTFRKVHFGYGIEVTSQKGDKFFVPQTFDCIEETDRDGSIKIACDECTERRTKDASKKAKQAELEVAGKTKDEIAVALKHVNLWLREHNLDKKWWMLAKDQSGKWGVLTISYTCGKLFQELLKKLAEKGMDPLGAEKGVWFKFSRSGNSFNDIVDTVEVLMEEQPDGSFRMKFDTLTDADYGQLEKLPDLNEFGRKLTGDQIQSLVQSGGDEKVVRSVLAIPTRSETTQPKTETKPAEPTEPTQPATLDEEAALMAQLEALKAKKAAVSTNGAGAPTPSATLKAQAKLPMDQFLKQFETK